MFRRYMLPPPSGPGIQLRLKSPKEWRCVVRNVWNHLPKDMATRASKVQRLTLENHKPRKEYTLLLLQNMFELVRKVTRAHFVRFEVLVAMNILAYDAVHYCRYVPPLKVWTASSSHSWHICTRLHDVTPHKTVTFSARYSALFHFFFLYFSFIFFLSSLLYPFSISFISLQFVPVFLGIVRLSFLSLH